MRRIFLFVAIMVCLIELNAANPLYEQFRFGGFQAGYFDTVLYDSDFEYAEFGYEGHKPVFVQIWYPTDTETKPQYLQFGDFLKVADHTGFEVVSEQLQVHYREMLIRDVISYNLLSGDSNVFPGYSYDDILLLLEKTETRSIYKKPDSLTGFPVILYHHGSQSAPFENYLMAEYLASHGFVFIAAGFHLPFPNIIFGLKPFNKIVNDEEQKAVNFILDYAKTVCAGSKIFFAGHSLGAQMGWRSLASSSAINGFISLETTLEFKNDSAGIVEYWPELWQKLKVEKPSYPFPVMLCAATGTAKSFPFFADVDSPWLKFVSAPERFEHNAYTSVFYLRCSLDSNVIQNDLKLLKDRMKIYAKHLDVIKMFLDDILNNNIAKGTEVLLIGD